jgi:hypothetical protein
MGVIAFAGCTISLLFPVLPDITRSSQSCMSLSVCTLAMAGCRCTKRGWAQCESATTSCADPYLNLLSASPFLLTPIIFSAKANSQFISSRYDYWKAPPPSKCTHASDGEQYKSSLRFTQKINARSLRKLKKEEEEEGHLHENDGACHKL